MVRVASRRAFVLLGFIVAAGLTAAGWSQDFVVLSLTPEDSIRASLQLTGSQVVPILGLLALTATIALVVAVISRGVWRFVLVTLCLVLAVAQVVTTILVMVSPLAFVRSLVAAVSGVYDPLAQQSLVVDLGFGAGLVLALIGAVLQILMALVTFAAARSWVSAPSRYDRRGARTETGHKGNQPEDDSGLWDTLSGGGDPTAIQGD